MLKRFAVAFACLFASMAPAHAYDYTDVYFNPNESGWGVFLVQSDTTQFLAFFIYDSSNKPVWYTAQLALQSSGAFTGPLVATTGSYFAGAWNPSQLTVNAAAGTASFTPLDRYRATLTYQVNGAPAVTKTIQRQTLTSQNLTGPYDGALFGTTANCTDPTQNDPQGGRYYINMSNVQNGEQAAALNITFQQTNWVCRIDGPLAHVGRLYKMTNATFSCTGTGAPSATTVTVNGLHPTAEGLEGHINGRINNCDFDGGFTVVRSN
jgi:hypothetical protein